VIRYISGNLFESQAEAIVNTVNTVGVMGKGIALKFKKLFPTNYKKYKDLCDKKEFEIGQLLVVKDYNFIVGDKIIINFPTKKHWRFPSEYIYIEKGLDELLNVIRDNHLKSIAIPPIGCGNGGLQWFKVKEIIDEKLGRIQCCEITVYEPTAYIKGHM